MSMNINIKDIIEFIIGFISGGFSVGFFITNKKKSNKINVKNVKNSENINIAAGDING